MVIKREKLVPQKISLKIEKLYQIYGKNYSEIKEICTKVAGMLPVYSCGTHILSKFYLQNINNKADDVCVAEFGRIEY